MAEEERELSEQEERAWEEKKRMRERISSIMGQYLLKGYRMLNVNCAECGNILLQTKEGTYYCVYCTEVAIESPGGGVVGGAATTEVTSTRALCVSRPATGSASTQTKPSVNKAGSIAEPKVPIVCTGRTSDTFKLTTSPADHDTMRMSSDTKRTGVRINPAVIHSVSKPTASHEKAHSNRVEPLSPKLPHTTDALELACTEVCLQTQAELVSKLRWCTSELEKSPSLEHSILLCRLISAAGEALNTLRQLPTLPGTQWNTDTQ